MVATNAQPIWFNCQWIEQNDNGQESEQEKEEAKQAEKSSQDEIYWFERRFPL